MGKRDNDSISLDELARLRVESRTIAAGSVTGQEQLIERIGKAPTAPPWDNESHQTLIAEGRSAAGE